MSYFFTLFVTKTLTFIQMAVIRNVGHAVLQFQARVPALSEAEALARGQHGGPHVGHRGRDCGRGEGADAVQGADGEGEGVDHTDVTD